MGDLFSDSTHLGGKLFFFIFNHLHAFTEVIFLLLSIGLHFRGEMFFLPKTNGESCKAWDGLVITVTIDYLWEPDPLTHPTLHFIHKVTPFFPILPEPL